MELTELVNTSKLVKAILETDKQARNSDSYLYHKVLEYVARSKNIDTRAINVHDFWIHWYQFFPNTETVRRTRQKVQQEFPELAATDKVGAMRKENEAVFKAFAIGGVDRANW